MSGSIETEPTADFALWQIWQYMCRDCGWHEGVPVFYGDAETYAEAVSAINRHKIDIHGEWQPANPEVES